jgi:hypothetical protein
VAKDVRTITVEVPTNELYRIVRGLDQNVQPLLRDQDGALAGYAPEEVVEDLEGIRLVTRGTHGGLITAHNFSPNGEGGTEVMLDMDVGLLKGGKTAINLNMVMWIMTYKGIEAAYREARSVKDAPLTAPGT